MLRNTLSHWSLQMAKPKGKLYEPSCDDSFKNCNHETKIKSSFKL